MNNYCIHLNERKNKSYCKLLNKEINLSECNSINSKNKCREYKAKNEKNSVYKNDIKISKIKFKSKKLVKLEQNKKSVFTDDLELCYLCSKYLLFCGIQVINDRSFL